MRAITQGRPAPVSRANPGLRDLNHVVVRKRDCPAGRPVKEHIPIWTAACPQVALACLALTGGQVINRSFIYLHVSTGEHSGADLFIHQLQPARAIPPVNTDEWQHADGWQMLGHFLRPLQGRDLSATCRRCRRCAPQPPATFWQPAGLLGRATVTGGGSRAGGFWARAAQRCLGGLLRVGTPTSSTGRATPTHGHGASRGSGEWGGGAASRDWGRGRSRGVDPDDDAGVAGPRYKG